jgi:hypothetical protein
LVLVAPDIEPGAEVVRYAGADQGSAQMKSQVSSWSEGTKRNGLTILAAVVAAAVAIPAQAQLPVPASSQFDITGFIQEATLGAGSTGFNVGPGAGAHAGGIIKVNGHVIIVPSETIVILPATAFTWQELFALAPAPYTGVATGMALADIPAPLTTYEAHVTGNRVLGGTGGPDVYIAGLIHISQQDLNSGAGFINFMDYTLGEMRVGGIINDPNCAQGGTPTTKPLCSGTRVRLNDPLGRFGRTMGPTDPTPSPDPRFAVDDANPTMTAGTGFPMCFPRAAPSGVAGVETDALCPQSNRPQTGGIFSTNIQMNDPVNLPGVPPDATKQAPFEVGDYVTFAGTLVHDGVNPTAGPWPTNGTAGTYVSAHTIVNNVAVFTWPGTNPAYISVEVSLIGTGGLTVLGAGEAAIRTRFEGMSTDPSRNVHLYGIDLDPLTGATTDRDWGTIGVDPGPPTGAVKGRWRFRPPCTATVADQKSCTPPPAGTFLPPTREMRAVIEGLQSQNPANPLAIAYANGIFAGQYHAPIGEYIFPENIPGSPIVENNFNTIAFLSQGGYTSSTGTRVGQLNPWPSSVVPAPACSPAVAGPGGPYTVASGGSVALAATATGTAPISFQWTAPAAGQGTLSALTVANPTFTAPTGPATVNLTVTASNACGTSQATAAVNVSAPGTPTLVAQSTDAVFSGATHSYTVTATDPNVPPSVPISFTVSQTGTPALTNLSVTPSCTTSPCTVTVTYTAPVLPVGQITSTSVVVTVNAKNAGNVAANPVSTTVTVNPLPDSVLITATEYRTGKQRLTVNASSTVVSPNVILTLAPYVTATGTTFDPAQLGAVFTNNGGGLYILVLVGAPEPAVPPATPLVVKSNLGGVSPPHGLDRIRQ